MSKVQLTGAFARFRGKLNRSESLVFKGCPCGKEQMAMDLLNPSKATGAKNVACQNALKTAAQAAKTALTAVCEADVRVMRGSALTHRAPNKEETTINQNLNNYGKSSF